MPTFRCDLNQPTTPFPHSWEHTVGSGHAPLALRADWQEQLRRCRKELGVQHVRFHGLLSDDMGTLIMHQDRLLYSFLNADRIFDFLLSIGMRPFIELSFMPGAIASGDQTVFKYRANVTPPKDYDLWDTLISRLVRHWIDRYGLEEVRTWPMEVWNEPNQPQFWPAGWDKYCELYRHTAQAIKQVDSGLRVGGPATSKNAHIEEFLKFCTGGEIPVDFISTHFYPTDPFGTEYQNTEDQLAHSRRGIMCEQAQDTRRQACGLPVYYTEWSTSSNSRDPLHDESYAAAYVAKTLMDTSHLVEGYSFWTFSDIFEENYFPSEPFHGGFGLLNLYGIPKPSYRVYEMLHHLGNELCAMDGLHNSVNAWTTRADDSVTVLLTNLALPQHTIVTERVEVTLQNCPAPKGAFLRRIDADHGNPKRMWEELGKPTYLSPWQVDLLEDASRVAPATFAVAHEDGTITFNLEMPLQSVASITIVFDQPVPWRQRG
jgi:xylan 1,4-beta-xylosidase